MIITTTTTVEGKTIREYCGIVTGVDLDYEVVGAGGGMLMVSASGTAVRLR